MPTKISTRKIKRLKFQAAVNSGLIDMNKRWGIELQQSNPSVKTRKSDIMVTPYGGCLGDIENTICEILFVKNKIINTATTYLSTVWYEWYTRLPRLCMSEASWPKIPDYRKTVAVIKIFHKDGFTLDEII